MKPIKTVPSESKFEILKAEHRGIADAGWLHSRHSFSFGHYFNPNQIGFSSLLVINDDTVQPESGFGLHPHRDMEIFTYVLSGELEHRDSMGTGAVIRPGEVQIMSAGTGVRHSETNPSATEPVHLLQIWIEPAVKNLTPRYQQQRFPDAEKRGRLRLILSPQGDAGSLIIHQDARVYAGLLDGGETFAYEVPAGRYAFLHVARGELKLNGIALRAGDGVRIREPGPLELTDGRAAEVLVFDLPPHELPEIREG